MKKFNIFLAALFVAVMGLTFVGCLKESEFNADEKAISEQNNTVKTEILVFANEEEYSAMLDKLNSMTADEYNTWLKENHFVSMKSKFDEFVNEQSKIDENLGEEQFKTAFYELGKKYSDVAILSKFEDGSEYYAVNIANSYFERIVNTKGQLQIGKTVYSFTKSSSNELIDKMFSAKGTWSVSGEAEGFWGGYPKYRVEWTYSCIQKSDGYYYYNATAKGFKRPYIGFWSSYALNYTNNYFKYKLSDGTIKVVNNIEFNNATSWSFTDARQVLPLTKGYINIANIEDSNNSECNGHIDQDDTRYYPSPW